MNLHVDYRKADDLIPYARNARTHSEAQVEQIARSIKEFGWTNPVLVDGANGVIAGHGRLLAAKKLGMAEVPVIELSHMTEEQKRAYIIADNKLADAAGWDAGLLRLELGDLATSGFDLDLTGFGKMDLKLDTLSKNESARGSLAQKFLVPPFTVLNARDAWWRDRKRAWLNLGLRPELGRKGADGSKKGLLLSSGAQPAHVYIAKNAYEAKIGNKVSWDEFYAANPDSNPTPTVSVFDPVLSEIIYRWFCPPGGFVLDPCAGESTKGIVASKLKRDYLGIDIREEQVNENRAQANRICETPLPQWICGDARDVDVLARNAEADLIFNCPPYADLEVYSDDPRDLSNMGYEAFIDAYRDVIRKSCDLLKDNRFACFVVGDVRDGRGFYRNFPAHTIDAFLSAGLKLYNEAILVTQVAGVAMRVNQPFMKTRKLGKSHQNVLIFVKGDPRKATAAIGDVECGDIEGNEDAEKV